MLALHETEEISIGDITPYDNVTPEEKLKMGEVAVEELMGDLNKYCLYSSLIDEFNAEKTKEAFFAHLCDKLECDLQMKKYSDAGYCTIENACAKVKNSESVKQLVASGAQTVADIFIAQDEGMYKGTIFEEIVNFLKTYDTTK